MLKTFVFKSMLITYYNFLYSYVGLLQVVISFQMFWLIFLYIDLYYTDLIIPKDSTLRLYDVGGSYRRGCQRLI